jgi:hypothetical protein
MNENRNDHQQPSADPDDPTTADEEVDPGTPGPGDSDAGPPPSGEEPDDEEIIRPD